MSMKRFWLQIAIVILIVASIGTYYIRGTSSHLPEFALVPKQGDAEAAEGVLVEGLYRQTRYSPSVDIHVDGSKYASERSFLESLDPYYWSSGEVGQLAREYRSFMRGKRADQSFYQDEQVVVYAGLDEVRVDGRWESQFDIAILNKQDEQTMEYEVRVPDTSGYVLDEYLYPYVLDVQVYGDELVIVVAARNYDTDDTEYRRYSLALASGEILSDEQLQFPLEEGEHVQRVWETKFTQAASYNVFYTVFDDEESGGTDYGQFMRYDLESGQMDALESPVIDEFLEWQTSENNMRAQIDGDRLMLTEVGGQHVRVLDYDLSADQGTVHQIEAAHVIHSHIADDRIYMLIQEDPASPASVHVVHLPTGEVLFEGAIEVKDSKAESAEAMQKLVLDSISLLEP